jgi:hypothetical protein
MGKRVTNQGLCARHRDAILDWALQQVNESAEFG